MNELLIDALEAAYERLTQPGGGWDRKSPAAKDLSEHIDELKAQMKAENEAQREREQAQAIVNGIKTMWGLGDDLGASLTLGGISREAKDEAPAPYMHIETAKREMQEHADVLAKATPWHAHYDLAILNICIAEAEALERIAAALEDKGATHA